MIHVWDSNQKYWRLFHIFTDKQVVAISIKQFDNNIVTTSFHGSKWTGNINKTSCSKTGSFTRFWINEIINFLFLCCSAYRNCYNFGARIHVDEGCVLFQLKGQKFIRSSGLEDLNFNTHSALVILMQREFSYHWDYLRHRLFGTSTAAHFWNE